MYSLLLVDDEQPILNGLRYNIDWNSLGFQNIYTAQNGEEAFDILSFNRIDIVITDINMPRSNGIQLGEKIYSLYPNIKIILLSGYKEFEYAQKAVDFKAYQYVLKPVKYKELEDIVRGALVELINDYKNRSLLANFEKNMSDIKPFILERSLNLWLEKDQEKPWENKDIFHNLGIKILKEDWGFWILIEKSHSKSTIDNKTIDTIILELLRKNLPKNINMIPFLNLSGIYNFLFLDKKDNINSVNKYMVALLDTIQSTLKKSYNCNTFIIWSLPMSITLISQEYRTLSQKIKNKFGYLSNEIIGPEGKINTTSHIKSLDLQPSFSYLIASMERAKAISRIQNIFNELKINRNSNEENILQVYHTVTATLIFDSLQKNIQISQWGKDLRVFLNNAYSIDSIIQLEEQCKQAVNQYINTLEANQINQEGRLIWQIKQWVQANFSQQISIGDIAKEFNYNVVYLSQLFKNETGLTLKDYITKVRINHAKELLSQNMQVDDVSVLVGYNNYPHFSRTFRKSVGMSPKQYQQKKW